METKHTQGEWFINPRSSRNVRCGSKTIANCSQGQNGENEEEEIANATLISAAPELLEAAILALEAIEMYVIDDYIMEDTIAEISLRQAIKKAKGE